MSTCCQAKRKRKAAVKDKRYSSAKVRQKVFKGYKGTSKH